MGTRYHPDEPHHPYFVTFVTKQKRPILRGPVAGLFVRTLLRLREELRFLLPAYVVMPDHVHVIVVPHENVGLAKIVQYAKGRFAREYNVQMVRSGSAWQSRYYESMIRDDKSFYERVAYIENNPVEAGLVVDSGEYRYSSAANPTGDIERYFGGLQVDEEALVPG